MAGICLAPLLASATNAQATKKNIELEQAALAFFNFPGSIHLKKDQKAQLVTIYSDIVPKLQVAQQRFAAAKEKERVAMLNTKVNMRSLRKGTGPSLPPEVHKSAMRSDENSNIARSSPTCLLLLLSRGSQFICK